MNTSRCLPRSIGNTISVLILTAFVSTGCGLGMDAQAQLDRGQQAYDEGDYRAAAIDARNVLKSEPDNIRARMLLGLAAIEMNEGAAAEKELRRALSLGADVSAVMPYLAKSLLLQQDFTAVIEEVDVAAAATEADRLSLMRSRAQAYTGLGESAAARDIFMEILAADAEDIGALLGIVETYMAENNLAQARETLNQVLAERDQSVASLTLSGALYYRMRQFEPAHHDYEAALSLATKQSDRQGEVVAWTGLAEVHLATDDLEPAREAVGHLLELAPNALATAYFDARVAYLDKDLPHAQERLQQVLRVAPDYRPAQLLLGAVHLQSGNLSQAEMYLSAVVATEPSHAAARRLLAETRLQMNKLQDAKDALAPVLQDVNADAASFGIAARASMSGGNTEEAIEYLRRAVQTDPGNAELVLNLAGGLIMADRLDEARAVLEDMPAAVGRDDYRRELLSIFVDIGEGNSASALEAANDLLSRNADDASLLSFVGSINFSLGNLEAAREQVSRAQSLAPDDISPHLSLARIELAEGNSAAARAHLEAALEMEPENVIALVALARRAADEGERQESIDLLVRARKADAGAIAPRVILARLYLAQGDFGAVEDVVREALQTNDSIGQLHYLLGLAQRGQGAHGESLRSFQKSLELEPENPDYWLAAARAHISTNNEGLAKQVLQESYGQHPDHVQTGVLLSALTAKMGDLENALAIANELQQRVPDSAIPHVLEGELLAGQEQYKQAIQAYDTALEKSNDRDTAVRAYRLRSTAGSGNAVAPLLSYLADRPADHEVRMILAQAYESERSFADAAKEYARVVAASPDNLIALNNLAWIYKEMGDARAEDFGRRAYELASDNPNVVDTLAAILLNQGDLQEGVELRRKAVSLTDGQPEYRYRLAAALAAVGEREEARSILDEILADDVDFAGREEAEQLLEQL